MACYLDSYSFLRLYTVFEYIIKIDVINLIIEKGTLYY